MAEVNLTITSNAHLLLIEKLTNLLKEFNASEVPVLGVFAAFKSVSLVVKPICLMHSVHQVASVQSILVASFHSNDRTESE